MLTGLSRDDYARASQQLQEYLRPYLTYLPPADQETVELAFLQMVEAHAGGRRKNGDFYIIHPVEACVHLTRLRLDADTLAAALLHDVPEDTAVTLRELQENFPPAVVFLVSGITKLSVLKYQGEDRYAENLRRMFVAMSEDLRVIFIKLADRLHNLQTLEALPAHKARRIALESLEIYAPIAQKLGINYFQGRLEDLAFQYVYPAEYAEFRSHSELELVRRQKTVENIRAEVDQILLTQGLQAYDLKGRAKKYYSIYRKMQTKKLTLEQIRDLVALRIIVMDEAECYQVFALLNKHFAVVPGTTKDYIQRPKPNGYQSLHLTVRERAGGEPVEFQIRTRAMQEFAEYGVAAHWAYKQRGRGHNAKAGASFLDAQNLKWISELVDLSREEMSEAEYLARVKLDLFADRIFVMTPKGDVVELPAGATPLDFAYRIHEQIGAHATMALVNETPMKLSGTLASGDIVEIITDKHQRPKQDWLNIVKTRSAAAQIRAGLRKLS